MQDLSRAAEAAIPSIQMPINEPVRDYAPGSAERAAIERALADMVDQEVDIPLQIGGRVVRTGDTHDVTMPHDHHHRLGVAHRASDKEVRDAIGNLEQSGLWGGLFAAIIIYTFLRAPRMTGILTLAIPLSHRSIPRSPPEYPSSPRPPPSSSRIDSTAAAAQQFLLS